MCIEEANIARKLEWDRLWNTVYGYIIRYMNSNLTYLSNYEQMNTPDHDDFKM